MKNIEFEDIMNYLIVFGGPAILITAAVCGRKKKGTSSSSKSNFTDHFKHDGVGGRKDFLIDKFLQSPARLLFVGILLAILFMLSLFAFKALFSLIVMGLGGSF